MTPSEPNIVSTPRALFRPDPVIGWSLTPGYQVNVGFRPGVVQRIDPDGWRHVPGSDGNKAGLRVGLYGCSFTYGKALADEETFAGQLQAQLPDLRILNRGISGHGTVQNLLQLRRDIARQAVDVAVFNIIGDHRYRNIAHPYRMRQYLAPAWHRQGIEHVPVARLASDGRPEIVYHPIWQPVTRDAVFHIFLPDDFMINLASAAVLNLVQETAQAANMPVAFALLDEMDPAFNRMVQDRLDRVHDIATPHDAHHRFLPDDAHPNVAANTHYANGLLPIIEELCEQYSGVRL
ncbi:hypothetical protein [Tateyamaria sp. syn59]|uniref:hypothetical protein n=1 Tax=Tateyamaria sp. syn59 TaxID=2576942 RepID=UPI0011BE46EB|nr:hypothetical protein [Tateyamaria sp. syn59]